MTQISNLPFFGYTCVIMDVKNIGLFVYTREHKVYIIISTIYIFAFIKHIQGVLNSHYK